MESARSIDSSSNKLKMLLFSILGVIYFFIPLIPSDGSKDILMVYMVAKIKTLLSPVLPIILFLVILSMVVLSIVGRFASKDSKIKEIYGDVSNISLIIYIVGAIFAIMYYFGIGPESVIADNVAGESFGLAASVLLTISVAGIFIPLISEFGLLEFIGIIIEPLMRPIFKLPGHASINAMTSFVANPTVGVFFTNQMYRDKLYTTKEASSIAINFSFVSLGFFAVMTEAADILHLFNIALLCALIVTLLLSMIIIRIPPISGMDDTYIDGSDKVIKEEEESEESIWVRAYQAALEKSSSTDTLGVFKENFVDVMLFTQKIAVFIVTVATITLILVESTPIFVILGKPLVPILNLLRIPDAVQIAPGLLLGLAEMGLPATYIGAIGVAPKAAFFIVVLSSVQILMFSNSIPSILESDIPLNVRQLVLLFFIRTAVAIPIVAFFTHIFV